ncbi:NepR family anti-sigma factor [Qipengyuania sp. MTN3-11]|uniref:NepR family anti-sigma factor n=1 Tax=Qipengyuania sp. MTN3-11 TaxID=3056557 RepID=UPI0036F2644B
MTFERDNQDGPRGRTSPSGPGRNRGEPGWANGLKQLYDSVVDEDLPDTFKDLLSQLDKDEKD